MMTALPILKIKKHSEIRLIKGGAWIFSNEIENFAALKTLEKGSLVEVEIRGSQKFAIAYFNAHSLIAARILTHNYNEEINEDFFVAKISAAKVLRDKFLSEPFYRLVHSESDFLPGLIIDRFDNVFCCQVSTAGMEKLSDLICSALQKVFPNCSVIFRNESESRKLEGLDNHSRVAVGEIPKKTQITENGLKYLADISEGQKTGWFFDQRQNRKFISTISKDCDVLDAFCYLGGFGINALAGGAKSVTFVDSSKDALELAKENLALNFSGKDCEFINSKVYELFEKPEFQERQFDVVLLDPPAFIKSKKDFFSGMKGYEKLVRLAAGLVKENGILMLSSCSHHAGTSELIIAANDGLRKAGRPAKLIRVFGADFDHPLHPAMRESEYLKSLTFILE
jgi:23S rRNA (cytosine1962-C5)-methyltransferase